MARRLPPRGDVNLIAEAAATAAPEVYPCIMEGCTRIFARQNALAQHVQVVHFNQPMTTPFYQDLRGIRATPTKSSTKRASPSAAASSSSTSAAAGSGSAAGGAAAGRAGGRGPAGKRRRTGKPLLCTSRPPLLINPRFLTSPCFRPF